MSSQSTLTKSGLNKHPRATWLEPATGHALSHSALMREMAGKQAVLLGETHNIAEIHRWQLHVIAALHTLRPGIAVGFEMFPRACQPVLDRWVAGTLTTERFLHEVEWNRVWGFDADLYLPIFHFCRANRVPMLALNCHRPLVTRVGKEGWDAIPEEDRDGLTPSADATPAYREYLFSLVGSGPNGTSEGPMDPKFDRFIRAQQTWDRAFACNIAKALAAPEPPLVIGIIGRGHLEYGHGTPFQLRDLGIGETAILLPSTDEEADVEKLNGIADAIFRLDTPDPAASQTSGRAFKHGLEGTMEKDAFTVTAVTPESPAALAGFEAGDRLTGIGETPLPPEALLAALRRLPPGAVLPFISKRGTQTREAKLQRPPE